MASVLLWYLLAALTTTQSDARSFQASAPTDLTTTKAAWTHLVCARATGVAYGVDPDLLVSIAWHESRYRMDVATPLSRNSALHSCGVMTPFPVTSTTCAEQTRSVLAGYIAGADHVATWLRAEHGDVVRALGGVSGGYHFLAACRDHPTDVCRTPRVFLERAQRIKALRDRARHAVS